MFKSQFCFFFFQAQLVLRKTNILKNIRSFLSIIIILKILRVLGIIKHIQFPIRCNLISATKKLAGLGKPTFNKSKTTMIKQ